MKPFSIHARQGLLPLALPASVFVIPALLISALLVSGCAEGRIVKVTPAADAPFATSRGDSWKQAEKLWPDRQDPQQAWASLIAYRRAAEEQPESPEMWTRYAHACYFLATYTEQNQEWSNPDRAKGLYLEGARAAEAALRLNPVYVEKFAQSADEGASAAAMGGPWMEPAFWLAANRGRWALGEGRRTRLDGRNRLGGLVLTVARKNPSVYYGGPERFLAVMFVTTVEPKPDSARAHFDRAMASAPLFFGNYTLRAEYLAVLQKDSASFRSLLEYVLAMPADTLPGAEIENALEQAHARDLLARQADLFP